MELVRGFKAKFIDISKPADGSKDMDISLRQPDLLDNEFSPEDELQAHEAGR